jgi:Zinc finger, C3HC4 type (RING finger)
MMTKTFQLLSSLDLNSCVLLRTYIFLEEVKQLSDENRSLMESWACKVCMDNMISTVFLPCGHLVTCQECASKLRDCPVCRTYVRGTVKSFFSWGASHYLEWGQTPTWKTLHIAVLHDVSIRELYTTLKASLYAACSPTRRPKLRTTFPELLCKHQCMQLWQLF